MSGLSSRPVAALMLALTLLLVGAVAIHRLPLQLLPEGLQGDRIQVFIPLRGLAPPESEEKVVRPLEEWLRTIPGVRNVSSTIVTEYASLSVELAGRTSPELGAAEVRDRIQRARAAWPEGADRWWTWRESGGDLPLAFFAILVPEVDPHWNHVVDQEIRPRLEAVDGVGRLEIWGLMDEAVWIHLDREKVRGHAVDVRDLLERLGQDHFARPLGDVEEDGRRFLVRAEARFPSLEGIEDFPVRPGLRLGEIAQVERAMGLRNWVSRVDGLFAFRGMVRHAAGVNAVVATERLLAECERIRGDPRFEGVDFHFFFLQGAYIKGGLSTLVSAALQGGLLAVAVLFLFLRRVASTLAVALSIPLSLLATAGWLYFTGDSLNVFTLAGMTLAVGMVVDNAVVVLESIDRRRREGAGGAEAARAGTGEVALAVTTATLTTVAVFLPLVFITDNPRARMMLGSVGLPLAFSLVASLLVALFLLPAAARYALSRAAPPAAGARGPLASRAVEGLLSLVLRRRLPAAVAAVLLAVGALLGMRGMELGEGMGGRGFGADLRVSVEFPVTVPLQESAAVLGRLERFLEERREELALRHVVTSFSRRGGSVELRFAQGAPPSHAREVRARLRRELPPEPGCRVVVRGAGLADEEAGREGEQGFLVALTGRDSSLLHDLATAVARRLSASPLVETVEVGALTGEPELWVEVDRARAKDLGVSPEALFGSVFAGLRGIELSRFTQEGRELRLMADLGPGPLTQVSELKELEVFSAGGTPVPLSGLARFTAAPGYTQIRREAGRTTVHVTGRRADGVGPLAFSRELAGVMREFPLPRGYRWDETGRASHTLQDIRQLGRAGLLSAVLVFLLMGILFESVLRPLAVLATLPFALGGGALALRASGLGLNPMAVVGMILLAGVVVNNGIVLLDAATRLRAQGMERTRALLAACRRRLRPIAMTAATTIMGLLPMALGAGRQEDGIDYQQLAVTVCGGLAAATALTLFLVPLAYTLLEDVTLLCGRLLRRVLRLPPALLSPR